MYEVIVAERRAAQLDLAARAKFAQHGESVRDTRALLDDQVIGVEYTTQESEMVAAEMFANGLMEVG